MKRWITGFGTVVTAMLVFATTASAATPAPSPAGTSTNTPGQGLEISPPVLELTANPGTTVTATIRVRNVSSGTLIASGKADDFSAGGEDGKPKLLLDETGATRYSLKYWVGTVPNLTLAPQELKTATVNIAVPANAEPGGHFGVIRFTATPPNLQGTGVALSASVGTLVLLRVNGTITDKLSVASFTSRQSAREATATSPAVAPGPVSSFFQYGPIDLTLRITNEGSVHEKPTGKITVKNMFGATVATLTVNPTGGNVLPGSTRRFDQKLDKKALFGYYTAKYEGSYLDDNHKLTATHSFWVIPWVLVLLVLLGLAILIWLIRLAVKRYNAFIIAQARKK